MQKAIPTFPAHLCRDGVELLGIFDGLPDIGRVFAAEDVPSFIKSGQPSRRNPFQYAVGQEIENLTEDELREIERAWEEARQQEASALAVEFQLARDARDFDSIPTEEIAHLGFSPACNYADDFPQAA